MAGSPELSQKIEEVFLAQLREKSTKIAVFVPVIIGVVSEFNSINEMIRAGSSSRELLGIAFALGDLTLDVQQMVSTAGIICDILIDEKDYSKSL